MRIKLETDTGVTYTIKRDDGVRFIAASASTPSNNPAKRWKKYRWAVWPKGHMETRMYFKRALIKLSITSSTAGGRPRAHRQ